jgi:hypothetical protein
MRKFLSEYKEVVYFLLVVLVAFACIAFFADLVVNLDKAEAAQAQLLREPATSTAALPCVMTIGQGSELRITITMAAVTSQP